MKTSKFKLAGSVLFTLAALALTAGAQPTNLMLYNFDANQVSTTPYGTAWGNWFGGVFQSVAWDSTSDAMGSTNSGSMKLQLNFTGSDQYVLFDGFTPNYGPLPLSTFTNLSFDIRYDISSAIRTNTAGGGVNGSQGVGSLDFGDMRIGTVGGVSPGSINYAQDWYYYFAIPATNGLGEPNTNWVHVNVDLRGVSQGFSDLNGGINDILIGMDAGSYGNNVLVGPQTIWFDNIKVSGTMPHFPPPTMSIQKATPSLWMFGGSGVYGRSQVALQSTNESWIGGTFPVTYSFTILDNATSPGGLQTGIQFIGGAPGNASYFDWGAANVLWLRIISGAGANTACVADISWKTNFPGHNPNEQNTALTITNPVLAGTWTLTFLSDTNGKLTAPGASPAPFTLPLDDTNAIAAFGNPVQVRFGHENNGNTANSGVPHYWANISVSNTAAAQTIGNINENFGAEGTNQLNPAVWNLATSDGTGVTDLVPTNAPYWIKWNAQGDAGFALVSGTSLTSGLSSFNVLPTVAPITQAGLRWVLISAASLPAGPVSYFALINRTFSQLQVLLPGETNAPNTSAGKVGTPDPVSFGASGGVINVTINAVDSTYHIVTSAPGDTIALGSTDTNAVATAPAALVNGTVTEQVQFGSTGDFTITATNVSNLNIAPATSSPVTVGF